MLFFVTPWYPGWFCMSARFRTMCPASEISAGESYKPNDGHVILSPFASSLRLMPRFFIWESDSKIGTDPSSKMSTCVLHGGFVGNEMMHDSLTVSFRESANMKCVLHFTIFILIPYLGASRANAVIASLDAIERVHPRSSMTYVGLSFIRTPLPMVTAFTAAKDKCESSMSMFSVEPLERVVALPVTV